ncbi:MAG TPA: hypothetical protein VFE46_02035 [Pirellulales bacterium]|nr:hypothetical protein [Pirellulales bacterium]
MSASSFRRKQQAVLVYLLMVLSTVFVAYELTLHGWARLILVVAFLFGGLAFSFKERFADSESNRHEKQISYSVDMEKTRNWPAWLRDPFLFLCRPRPNRMWIGIMVLGATGLFVGSTLAIAKLDQDKNRSDPVATESSNPAPGDK